MSLLLLAALFGCDDESRSRDTAMQSAATAPATQPLTAEQLEYARRPISYFNDNCGKCHGSYGTYWLGGVLAGLGEQKLREEVDLMAAGPARAPLEGLALEAQVAYHRSLVDGRPFVTVFREPSGLAGEVTPGSRVLLMSSGREQEAEVTEHRWSSSLRDATAVRVVRDGATTELPLEALGPEDAQGVLSSHARPAE